jgi:hypothetical protein
MGVSFAYDLNLGRTIARWKGLSKEYIFCCHTLAKAYRVIVASPKNDVRVLKRLWKFRTRKVAKVETPVLS